MESHVTNYLKLDQEFDKCLAEMKPHVLKLPHKTGEMIQDFPAFQNLGPGALDFGKKIACKSVKVVKSD